MARAAQHYRDSAGKEIHGLAQRPNGGRFYAVKDRNRTFGRDPTEAVRKFRLWEQQRAGKGTILIDAKGGNLPSDLMALLMAGRQIRHDRHRRYDGEITVESFWETVAHLIRKRPQLVAEKTGIEQLAYLTDIQPPAPSIRIEQVAQIYQDKRNCGDKEKRQGQTTWTEFVKVIRQVEPVKTLREIRREHIEHYHAWIHARNGGKWTATTIKRRFASIRTQLRYALRRSEDTEQIRRVLDLTALFEAPNGGGATNPQPISVDDFKKLLEACKETPTVDPALWECLLLMSLNFCFYPKDLAGLENQHCNLKDGTMVYRRSKTGVMRVGVFWKRTIKALAAYQAKHNHGLDTVFATYYRGGYSPLAKSTMNAQFGKIRDKAGLAVKMDQLRDGGQTAAIQGGADPIHADILMGHKTGMKDHYLARNPQHVADACEAIERHYFGGRK